MSLMYAKLRLAEWGRWSRDTIPGYPRQSAVVGEYGSRASGYMAELPPHVAYVDMVVRQMPIEPRRVLIVHYTQAGTQQEKATRTWMSYGTYRRLLREGQDHVSIELEYESVFGACHFEQQKVKVPVS